jgi:hypothetical protein
MQWPHRTLRSIEKKIAALRAEQKFTKDDVAIEEQIAKLQARRESILSGRTSGLGDQEGAGVMLPSVSDDSSNSTTQSQASSPRTSLDISRVSFDKSLSLGEGTSSPALSTSSTRVSSQGTLTRIRSLNDVQKAAEKQAAAGQSSMAWGQNRSSSSSSSSSSNRGFTGRRAVSHESLFSLQNHQEAAHSFQSTSRPPVYSPNLKPCKKSARPPMKRPSSKIGTICKTLHAHEQSRDTTQVSRFSASQSFHNHSCQNVNRFVLVHSAAAIDTPFAPPSTHLARPRTSPPSQAPCVKLTGA